MSAGAETVGLLHYPWGEDGGAGRTRPRTPRRAYASAIAYRANARPPGYMSALLEERHPGALLVRTGDPGWERQVAGCDRLVLLYPDSTGIGWAPLERRLTSLTRLQPEALNGRGRGFALNPATVRELRVRRALERSMVGEIAGLVVLGLLTLPLLAWDVLRGRR